jgi:septal ring factor EnvC (AmiA/AmiB activator)
MRALLASITLTLLLLVPFAATAVPDDDVAEAPPKPAELRALKAGAERQVVELRDENAALAQRVQVLEESNAALGTQTSELDARLADLQDRLTRLETLRKD